MLDRHTIETRAGAGTSQVRAHVFPALEEGSVAFPEGRYLVDFERIEDASTSSRSIAITHRIEGAPLLERLMEAAEDQRVIRFVCSVSSPFSSFRATQISPTARQQVTWDEDDMGEPPMFTPMIVVAKPFRRTLDKEQDGVHALWHGQSIAFEPGMRLAVSSVVQLRSSVFPLMSFHEDEKLQDGQFQVAESVDGDFSFRVNLAPDLNRFLREKGFDAARENILTHVVSSCFALLKADHAQDNGEEGWQSYRSLVALAEQLRSQGLTDWTDKDFSPELAATNLRPHKITEATADEGEE